MITTPKPLPRTCPVCARYTHVWVSDYAASCGLCETGIEKSYQSGPDAPPVTISPRQQVLDMAKKAVLTDRNNTHGDPEDSGAAIAALWKAWEENKSADRGEVHEIWVKMLLLKVARMGQGELNIDDYADAAGYASCAYEAAVKEKKVV